MAAQLTPQEAHAAILAGQTVKVVVGHDAGDPVLLTYLDRCRDDGDELMIYTEAIGGWSEGVKEAICEPKSAYYADRFAAGCVSLTVTEQEPMMREALLTEEGQPRNSRCSRCGVVADYPVSLRREHGRDVCKSAGECNRRQREAEEKEEPPQTMKPL